MPRLIMKNFFFLLIVLLFAHAANGQTDSLQAEKYVVMAKAALKQHKTDSATIYHDLALKVFKEKNLLVPWLKSYSTLAYVIGSDLKQPFQAVELVEKSLQEKWRSPSTNKEWEQLAMSQLAAGHILNKKAADLNGAKKYYEAAEEIFQKKLDENCDRIAVYLYHNLANIYTRHGDYERAIRLLEHSLAYNRLYPGALVVDHGDLAIALNETGKYTEALEIVRQGFALPNISSKVKISLTQNEADALLKLNRPTEALKALDRIPSLILKMVEEKGSLDEQQYRMDYFSSRADLLLALGKMTQAEDSYLKAIKEGVEYYGTRQRREIGKIFDYLGTLKLRQGKYQEALSYFHQGLQCVVPGFETPDPTQAPDPKKFINENTILEALEGKAKAFVGLGQLEKALVCYELIPIVEAKLRATHAYESSSLLALSESRSRFDQAVSIAWMLYERSNGNRSFADRAFRLTEQARGMLLLQSLALAQAKYQLPEAVRQQESSLKVKLAWYEHEIASEEEAGADGDAQRLAQLKKELFDLKQEDEKFSAELRQNYPDYAALSDEIHFLESNEVPSLLRQGQALIDYYLTNTDAYIFSFDEKGSFYWRKAVLPVGFRESVAQFAEYLAKGDEEDKNGALMFRNNASAWYELLLAPELQRMMPQSGSLIIVPDDALVFVPFEVLLRQPAPTGNWRDLPWLLADYNTSYAYSATLLKMQQNISQKHRERKEATRFVFSGFAPSYSSTGVYKLTSTESMVNSAQKLLGGKTWCSDQANEATFKDVAPQCRLLLLAMHGLADAENPELSRLLFGDPRPDSLENDNVLYASELQIMQLQADLAVLSACHSGFGKLQKGEGVFSLARAFARAGVPATLMSMWLLHENTAGPLVQTFLQYLQAGKTKDEALRLAKLDFLKNDQNFEMSHPFYWAGVMASGDMCALDIQRKSWGWWWVVIGLAALFGGWLVFRQSRRRSNVPV